MQSMGNVFFMVESTQFCSFEGKLLPLVPEVFFSLEATEFSGEAAKASREAARKKPLAPTDNNLTSMPTPIFFD